FGSGRHGTGVAVFTEFALGLRRIRLGGEHQMADRTTVLIAGAGPVGLTLANELVRHGVAVRIVDKAAARTDKSKALVLWSRSLELIARRDSVHRHHTA